MPAKPPQITDPYATLGLEPGAPAAEVKRAYRRLAKAFHPDSAGEQAIPRFLAIQAAYEQIRTGRVTLGGMRSRGASAAGNAASTSEPWRADPARARAARERARSASAGSGAGAARGTSGASGSGTAGGATGGRRSTGTSGAGAPGGTRKRATRKATMGSTSYDEARDPADATWSGASWYGPSTGEYWIVNPREYADPRKHGPDYQQRARRPLQDREADALPEAGEAADGAPDSTPDGPTATGPTPAGPSADGRAAPPARGQRSRPAPRWSPAATESGWTRAGDAGPSVAAVEEPAAEEPAAEEPAAAPLRWLGEPADDPVRRLGIALVAWPPIGLAAAALIGEATGCTAFGAQCDGTDAMLPWLAQALVLGVLLLVPALTRILATGTIALLAGVAPVTAFLLAFGASGAPQAAPALAVLLGTAWLVGVAWAVARRVRRPDAGSGAGVAT